MFCHQIDLVVVWIHYGVSMQCLQFSAFSLLVLLSHITNCTITKCDPAVLLCSLLHLPERDRPDLDIHFGFSVYFVQSAHGGAQVDWVLKTCGRFIHTKHSRSAVALRYSCRVYLDKIMCTWHLVWILNQKWSIRTKYSSCDTEDVRLLELSVCVVQQFPAVCFCILLNCSKTIVQLNRTTLEMGINTVWNSLQNLPLRRSGCRRLSIHVCNILRKVIV